MIHELPNGERADLGSKIEDYVLNPSHWEGRHKAPGFESMLGITVDPLRKHFDFLQHNRDRC